jgi:hypothetical protein
MRRRKQFKQQEQQKNTKTPSLGEVLIFGMCLGVNVIALVLNVNFRKLGWIEWRWLGVFIASNHFLVVG